MKHPRRLVLLGHPVSHSFSPAMQNAALSAAGIQARYSTMDIAAVDLRPVLDSLARERAAGNITIPHKEAARILMQRLTPLAERVGAVNTFFVGADGALVGDNTDVSGFSELVASVLGGVPAGKRFAVIGAGGAAAAVLAAIEKWDRCVATVYGRDPDRSAKLATRFGAVARAKSVTPGDPLDGEIVVNATPVGLNGADFPAPLSSLLPHATVLDLVCRAGETAWVRAARAAGHVASDGFPMLVGQGAAAFEIWFGMQPDREAMWRGLKEQTQDG